MTRMGKIPVDGLIAIFRQMYEEHWQYVWGAARQGCVDCSGAFVYAYKQLGHQSIAHGSNAIARSYVRGLLPISKAVPGMAAFKLKTPGQAGYALPDRYKSSADKNDYYHIGLVDSDGKHVLNAQGEKAGFTRTPIEKWAVVGYLNAVDYGDDDKMETYIVTAENGLPVRVRDTPNGKTVDRLKVGTMVEAGEPDADGWQQIRHNGKSGYMMSKFLRKSGDGMTITMEQYEQLCQARDLMIKVLGVG